MLQLNMEANIRQASGKGGARTLRRAGQTPAILYGAKNQPLNLVLDTKELTRMLLSMQHQNAVINLDITENDNKLTKQVMVKEIQSDPVTDTLLHADFWEISVESSMVFKVQLRVIGKAKGVDLGGDLHVNRHYVTLKGKVFDIPDVIEIDVTPLEIGQRLTCKDLNIPPGVVICGNIDDVCVSVVEPAAQAPAGEGKEASK